MSATAATDAALGELHVFRGEMVVPFPGRRPEP
jgi:hypothetical protein